MIVQNPLLIRHYYLRACFHFASHFYHLHNYSVLSLAFVNGNASTGMIVDPLCFPTTYDENSFLPSKKVTR